MMLLKAFLSVLLTVSVNAAAISARSSNSKVYAYGTGISGLPIVADADGIGYVTAATSHNFSDVTWAITAGGGTPWNVTTNSTNTTTSSLFYIVTTEDAYSPIGFLSPNDTSPTGAQMMGFTTYGTDISYKSGTALQSQFWASETGVNDTWIVRWNVNGASRDGSVPVTLKTVAPSKISA